MSPRYYRLTVKTSCKSVTAFCLDADGDEEAIGKALKLVAKFDSFCDEPSFEVIRGDGTRVPCAGRVMSDVTAA